MNIEELEEYARTEKKLCESLERETNILIKFNQTSELFAYLIKYHQAEASKILDSWWRFVFQSKKLTYHMQEQDRLLQIWKYLCYLIRE